MPNNLIRLEKCKANAACTVGQLQDNLIKCGYQICTSKSEHFVNGNFTITKDGQVFGAEMFDTVLDLAIAHEKTIQ